MRSISSSSSSSSGSSDDIKWRRRHLRSASPAELSTSSEDERSEEQSSEDEDGMSGRLLGDKHAQAKFRRLRRIFLSQERKRSPKSKKMKPSKISHCKKPRSVLEDEDAGYCSEKATTKSNHPTTSNDRRQSFLRNQSILGQTSPTSHLQGDIDNQIRALCKQVELLSAQSDANANQRELDLQRAIEEVEEVRLRRQQQLEAQVRLIEESYEVQLKILAQQFEAKRADMQREMRVAIQKQREQSENAVLAAIKQFQLEAQTSLQSVAPLHVGNPKTRNSEPLPDPSGWRFREDFRAFQQSESPLSPMARQRAKLHAFEKKLRTLPKASVARAVYNQQQRQQQRVPSPVPLSVDIKCGDGSDRNQRDWQRAPLSPLRSSPSRWKRGISRASQIAVSDDDDDISSNNDNGEVNDAFPSVSAMSKRFLRPEEEQELRRLRNSIGLAKDWIERNVQGE